jgi:hypothetical protein
MAKFKRLTPAEKTLTSTQIWVGGEAHFQTFDLTAEPAKYPYNFGIIGQDIGLVASKETVNMGIVTAALLDQNFKLDLPTNVQNQSIAYQTALRFNTTTDHLFMPEGLEFKDN